MRAYQTLDSLIQSIFFLRARVFTKLPRVDGVRFENSAKRSRVDGVRIGGAERRRGVALLTQGLYLITPGLYLIVFAHF